MPTNDKPRLKNSKELLDLLGASARKEEAAPKNDSAPSRRRGAASHAVKNSEPEPAVDHSPLDFGKYQLPAPPPAEKKKAARTKTAAGPERPETDNIPEAPAGGPASAQQVAAMLRPEPKPLKRRGRPRKKDTGEASPAPEKTVIPEPEPEPLPAPPPAHHIPDEAVQEYSFTEFDDGAGEALALQKEEEARAAREVEQREREAREKAEVAERERLRAERAEQERLRLIKEEEERRRLMQDERSREDFMRMLASEFENKFQEKYSAPLPVHEKPVPKKEPEAEAPPTAKMPEPEKPLDEPDDDSVWFEQVLPDEPEAPDDDPQTALEADLFVEQFAQKARQEEAAKSESFKETLTEKFMRERERYLHELAIHLERENAEEREAERETEPPRPAHPEPARSQRRRLDFRIRPEMHQADDDAAGGPLIYKPDATVRYQREPEEEPQPLPEPQPPSPPLLPKTAEERLMELARGLPSTPRSQQPQQPGRRLPPETAQAQRLQEKKEPKQEPRKGRGLIAILARAAAVVVLIAAAGFGGLFLKDRFWDNSDPALGESSVSVAENEPYKVYETRSATTREVHPDIMVMRSGVTLNNFHVTNYLIVEDVSDSGTVVLENVIVDGAIYLRSSAVDVLEMRDVKAARVIVNNGQKPMEIRVTGNTDIGTVEVKSAATLRQLAVEDSSPGIQNVSLESRDAPLELRMEGLSLFTLTTSGDAVINFLSTNAQSVSADGALSLYGTGKVTNLALSAPDMLNVLIKDVAVSNISAKSPGNVNVSTTVDTMALENPASLGGSGSIGSLTLNPKHENTRMAVDIAGLQVQVLSANTECLLTATGSARLNTVIANAPTNLMGNKANLLQVNDDNVLYENAPDRIVTSPGIRPPRAVTDSPNLDTALPASQANGGMVDVSGDGVSTLCGHPREDGGFTKGDGSVDHPYEISTAAQLAHISAHPGSHYVQGANIDIADDSAFASGFAMICADGTPFSGSYDGAGYTVSNLRISSLRENVGLFAENIGVIKNVAVVSGEVASTSASRAHVGGVVGLNYGNGVVEACSNGARVTARDSSYVGGIAGYNFGGRVRDCYNTAKIAGGAYTGGVAGVNLQEATVARSYNVGLVESNGTGGGVVGSSDNAVVTNCYFLEDTAELGIGIGSGTIFSRTAEEMATPQMVADLASGDDTSPWAPGSNAYLFPNLVVRN